MCWPDPRVDPSTSTEASTRATFTLIQIQSGFNLAFHSHCVFFNFILPSNTT